MTHSEDISYETMREKWDYYSTIIRIPNSKEYQAIWKDWREKHSVSKKKIKLLYDFIAGKPIQSDIDIEITMIKNKETMILKDLDNRKRYQYHMLCDKIGLHHKSKTCDSCRHLYIIKPDIWLWEFTKPNPYSKTPDFYEKRRNKIAAEKSTYVKKNRAEQKSEEQMRTNCCRCRLNGLEVELFCSVYFGGIYCEKCLDRVDDGHGEMLSCHKYEPVFW